MNAISPRHTFNRMQDPPHLHLASGAFSFLILDGSVTYSQAIGALMRAAIRDSLLRDVTAAYTEGLRDRLESTLNSTMSGVEADAAQAVRAMVRLCIARNAGTETIRAAADCVNCEHGRVLPWSCIAWIIREELAAGRSQQGTAHG